MPGNKKILLERKDLIKKYFIRKPVGFNKVPKYNNFLIHSNMLIVNLS